MESQIDYQQILQHEFEKRVISNPSYSLRAFARDLEISPSRICEVLARKNGLLLKNAVKISETLGLNAQDKELFYHSVCAQHARSLLQKQSSQKFLKKNQSTVRSRVLNQEEFRVIAHWYHFAILELIRLKNFELTSKNVAQRLGIHPAEALAAIERLKKMGWIRKESGSWRSKNEYRTVSSTTPSVAIRSFHTQLINKAERAIHRQEIGERFLHSLLLATTKDKLAEANQELERFCFEFNKKFGAPENSAEKLYALTLQFFRIGYEVAQNELEKDSLC